MSAAIAYKGSNSAVISAVTLSPTSVIGIAHSLPTTPDFWAMVHHYAGANTSLSSAFDVTMDSTTVSFIAKCGQTIGVDVFVKCLHSIER